MIHTSFLILDKKIGLIAISGLFSFYPVIVVPNENKGKRAEGEKKSGEILVVSIRLTFDVRSVEIKQVSSK